MHSDASLLVVSRLSQIVVRARDSSMGTRQYFRVRTQASMKPDGTEIPRCEEVRFEHLKKLGLEPDTGGSAPRNAPSNVSRLALPTHGPISSSFKSTACSFFKLTTPKNLPVGPACVDPLDSSARSILDIAFALGGSVLPSATKRRVEFERTRRVLTIPSRHSIPRAEKDGQWYTRSDYTNFARREKARRDRGGISLDEPPSKATQG